MLNDQNLDEMWFSYRDEAPPEIDYASQVHLSLPAIQQPATVRRAPSVSERKEMGRITRRRSTLRSHQSYLSMHSISDGFASSEGSGSRPPSARNSPQSHRLSRQSSFANAASRSFAPSPHISTAAYAHAFGVTQGVNQLEEDEAKIKDMTPIDEDRTISFRRAASPNYPQQEDDEPTIQFDRFVPRPYFHPYVAPVRSRSPEIRYRSARSPSPPNLHIRNQSPVSTLHVPDPYSTLTHTNASDRSANTSPNKLLSTRKSLASLFSHKSRPESPSLLGGFRDRKISTTASVASHQKKMEAILKTDDHLLDVPMSGTMRKKSLFWKKR